MTEHPIRTARKRQGLSVVELASRAGVSVPTVYAIESRRSVGRVSTVKSLARVLRLDVRDVIDEVP